jgi:parvulin-like peptidyl-prolyl isomerase
MFNKRMGREPTLEELRGEVNQLIRERILSREASLLGLDEDDVVVRRRLAQKMEFLFQDVSNMREPSDDQLRAYLRENRSAYEIPGQVSFSHVYFNTDERGDEEAAEAARRLAKQLNASEGVAQDTSSLGDRLLLPADYSNRSLPEIRGEFGPRFAEAVWRQEPGSWQGPVPSGYGLHAVYVRERTDAKLPEFSDLKERLAADWLTARQRELSRKAYERLRERYRVLVEGMPYSMDMGDLE